jgi:hypothetical protein
LNPVRDHRPPVTRPRPGPWALGWPRAGCWLVHQKHLPRA